jgi:pyruvate formate lyase activating enzyme
LLREAMLYTPLEGGRVRCDLCGRRCVIVEGNLGVCRARVNRGGRLYALSYGRACSASVDPIEKKPLFHFHPGALVFSVASPFCNFFCRFCDNWEISQQRSTAETLEMAPERVVKEALKTGSHGISYTYTEPTVFYEWAYDTAKLAHEAGLFNTFVTNGYMTTEAVEAISPYLDAVTVDFKGAGDPKFYREIIRVPSVEPIYDCLKALKRLGIHIEVTNLVVPKYGDSGERLRELAKWILDNLGEYTPFHILRFHPSYELIDLPATPQQVIEEGVKIARGVGLRYVYAGNVPGSAGESTFCHSCGELLVARYGFTIFRWRLEAEMSCPKCGVKIPIYGRYHPQ